MTRNADSSAIARAIQQVIRHLAGAVGSRCRGYGEVKTYRRSSPRVFLYLNSGDQSVFAAEFEGGDAEPEAHAAVARLNQVFSSITAASARIEVRPRSFMRPLIWGGFGFFMLLVLVIYRELFKPGTRHDDSSRPAPLRGGT